MQQSRRGLGNQHLGTSQHHCFRVYAPTELKGESPGVCTPMPTAALFPIAKRGKQFKRPALDEWVSQIGIYMQWNIIQP